MIKVTITAHTLQSHPIECFTEINISCITRGILLVLTCKIISYYLLVNISKLQFIYYELRIIKKDCLYVINDNNNCNCTSN